MNHHHHHHHHQNYRNQFINLTLNSSLSNRRSPTSVKKSTPSHPTTQLINSFEFKTTNNIVSSSSQASSSVSNRQLNQSKPSDHSTDSKINHQSSSRGYCKDSTIQTSISSNHQNFESSSSGSTSVDPFHNQSNHQNSLQSTSSSHLKTSKDISNSSNHSNLNHLLQPNQYSIDSIPPSSKKSYSSMNHSINQLQSSFPSISNRHSLLASQSSHSSTLNQFVSKVSKSQSSQSIQTDSQQKSSNQIKSKQTDKGKSKEKAPSIKPKITHENLNQNSQNQINNSDQTSSSTTSSHSNQSSNSLGSNLPHSSWWSWRSGSGIAQSTVQRDIVSLEPDHQTISHQTSLSNLENSTSHPNPQNPPSRISNWIYSWYSTQPTTIINQPSNQSFQDSLANPILDSISDNSKGWAGYFSSTRSLPRRKLQETEQKSVESMEIDPTLSASNSPAHSSSNPLKSPPSSSTNSWIGIGYGSIKLKKNCNDSAIRPVPSSSTFDTGLVNEQEIIRHNKSDDSEPKKSKVVPPLTDIPSFQPSSHTKTKAFIPNLVLPTFHDTFHHPPRSFLPKPSTLQKTFGLVQAYIFSAPPQFPQTVHLDNHKLSQRSRRKVLDVFHQNQHISTRLPKSLDLLGINRLERLKNLKKIAIIGIHGWFPGPWLESILGKPTGTSSKFASMMNDSVRKYFQHELGQALNDEFATLIALEGEGKVNDRVELLYQELHKRADWVSAVQEAQVVFVVSHSQGSLVSCILIERLIKVGLIKAGDQVLSLCMCGIWSGPFVGLNSSYAFQPVLKLLEGPAAHELFEFQDHHSKPSRVVLTSLMNCLSSGVKFLLVGSMNDQVVPLYSALNYSVNHPSILRTVFIDSAVFYSTDFLTNLVIFCQRLKNAGLSDHGLVNLLSEALIGSLNGVGHSTVYEEPDVFELAIRYYFETSSPLDSPTNQLAPSKSRFNSIDYVKHLPKSMMGVDHSFNPKQKFNPYLLTWTLRGLIEDRQIQMLFGNELMTLRKQFEDWKPISKLLKDLKLKLEPFKINAVDYSQSLTNPALNSHESETTSRKDIDNNSDRSSKL
ncbi:hypothetical protein O181_048621 [Austropuccinia psidii MF-1]|uniref:YMC020W-like alpha/beta hydrolase domain-containing protein n=1 Tax=Austropuccinia psidii MF-1 TaxID=1389203 RepID=A0A9Q3DR14_9BASI|nr:hypothetical protein [Austropuccinia psidii MF-1]